MNETAAPRKHNRLLILGVFAVALIAVGSAGAYWTSSGTGIGISSAGELGASTLSGTPGAGTATLTWSAVTAPGSGPVSYYVTRNGGNAGGNCPTSAARTSELTCTDSGLTAGTYSYTVTAVWRTWTSTSSPATRVTLASGALDHFVLAAATTTPSAGQTDNLTITAKDAAGNTVTSYGGSHDLTFSGASTIGSFTPTVTNSSGVATSLGSATTITFASGVATVSGSSNGAMTLYKAETASIVVSDGTHTNESGLSIAVGSVGINSFTIPNPGAQTAGAQFSLSLTAKDVYGNTAGGYTGVQCIALSGPATSPDGNAPGYPARGGCAVGQSAVTFTNGVASPSITLFNAASTTLTVTDAASGKIGSTGAFSVGAASIDKLSLAATTTTPAAGVGDNLTITALDPYGNTATSYAGSHNLTFSGANLSPGGMAPTVTDSSGAGIAFGTSTAISFTSGVAQVSGSSNGVMLLYKAETALVRASEGGSYQSDQLSLAVSPLAINKLSLSAASTTPSAGAGDNLTITALDLYGNTATSYAGSHNLTFSGANASGAGNQPTVSDSGGAQVNFGTQTSITFASGVAQVSGSNNGVMRLYKAETALVRVSEGTSYQSDRLSVTVSALGINSFSVAAATTTPNAGQADSLTITALDQYGNTATTYTGSHNLFFSGASSIGSNNPSVTNASGTPVAFGSATTLTFANGVANAGGVMTLYTAEGANVRAVEGTTSSNILQATVAAGALASFTIPTPSAQTAGTAFSLSLIATDSYGNTATSYTGSQCVAFSGPASSPGGNAPVYPAQGTCAPGQSSISFTSGGALVSVTLYNAASTTITATDSGHSGSSGAFTVSPLAVNALSLSAATTSPSAGAADSLTITALDQYGNTATSYTSSHNLSFSGASSIGSFTPTVTNSSGVATNFGSATAITFTNGVATVTGSSNGAMTLYKAGTASIVVNDGSGHTNGAGLSVTASPLAVNSLSLAAATTTPNAGAADSLTITALDQYGNTATSYTSSHNLTFSGASTIGSFTPTVTNSSGVATNFGSATAINFSSGVATVTGSSNGAMTLYKAGASSIVVSDGSHTNGAGLSVTVSPLSVNSLSLAAATTTPNAGAADNLTITALDQYGNTATSYTSSHSLTFSGASTIGSFTPTVTNSSGVATNFGSATAINFTSGVAQVSGSSNGAMTLYKAGASSIVVSDGSHTNGAGLSVTVSPLSVNSLSLAAATTTPNAGAADNLTITALDLYGNIATTYTGSHSLTFSGASAIGSNNPTVTNASGMATNFGTATAITFTGGVSTAGGVMTLYAAESATVRAVDGTISSNNLSVTVSPGTLASFTIPTPAAQTAGTQFAISLTAKDAFGNTATSYTGAQCVAFSGPANSPNGTAPVYPAQGTCAPGQSSVTFSSGGALVNVTLYGASVSTTINVTGSGKSGSTGAFAVNPAGISSFAVTNSGAQTAGTAFALSLTALDAYGNTATGYTGSKTVAFSGPANSPNNTAPSYPASVTFTNGSGSASVTLYNASTSTNITASESGHSGSSGTFTVNPAGISAFALSNPGTQTAGTAFALSLTALDAYGNTATGYTGSKPVAFSGPANSPNNTAPSYPASVTFANGVGSASVTLYNAVSSNITATESGHSGTTGAFTVNAAAASSFSIPNPGTQTAGTQFALTLTAKDAYGNTTTGYTGSKAVAFSGPANSPSGQAPSYPASVTFASGVGSANVTLYNAVSSNITASESAVSGSTGAFTVNPLGINSFGFGVIGAQTAGTQFSVSLTALDLYGNTAPTYTGAQCLTFSGASSSPGGTAPAYPVRGTCAVGQSAVTFANGVASANVTLYNAASTTLAVSGSGHSGSSSAFTVNAAGINSFAIPNPGTQTAGSQFALTLTATDAYGNTATGYTGSKTVAFSGPANSPSGQAPSYPASVTFTNGVGSASVTLYNAASANITATESGPFRLDRHLHGQPGRDQLVHDSDADALRQPELSLPISLTAKDA